MYEKTRVFSTFGGDFQVSVGDRYTIDQEYHFQNGVVGHGNNVYTVVGFLKNGSVRLQSDVGTIKTLTRGSFWAKTIRKEFKKMV